MVELEKTGVDTAWDFVVVSRKRKVKEGGRLVKGQRPRRGTGAMGAALARCYDNPTSAVNVKRPPFQDILDIDTRLCNILASRIRRHGFRKFDVGAYQQSQRIGSSIDGPIEHRRERAAYNSRLKWLESALLSGTRPARTGVCHFGNQKTRQSI